MIFPFQLIISLFVIVLVYCFNGFLRPCVLVPALKVQAYTSGYLPTRLIPGFASSISIQSARILPFVSSGADRVFKRDCGAD